MPRSRKDWKQSLIDEKVATQAELKESQERVEKEIIEEEALQMHVQRSIAELMKNEDVGFNELCRKTGLSRVTINKIVNGHCNITLDTLHRIAASFDKQIQISFK